MLLHVLPGPWCRFDVMRYVAPRPGPPRAARAAPVPRRPVPTTTTVRAANGRARVGAPVRPRRRCRHGARWATALCGRRCCYATVMRRLRTTTTACRRPTYDGSRRLATAALRLVTAGDSNTTNGRRCDGCAYGRRLPAGSPTTPGTARTRPGTARAVVDMQRRPDDDATTRYDRQRRRYARRHERADVTVLYDGCVCRRLSVNNNNQRLRQTANGNRRPNETATAATGCSPNKTAANETAPANGIGNGYGVCNGNGQISRQC